MSAVFNIPFLPPGSITVDEFEHMDLPESCEWELIDGTVVSVTFPDIEHGDIQANLYGLLREQFDVLGKTGPVVRIEYGYALGTHSRFRADVAVVDFKRHKASTKRLEGPPELIAEVMSRSNADPKMDRLQVRCFELGCSVFMRIYPKRKQVVVTTVNSKTEYGGDDVIRFDILGVNAALRVADLFESI